MKLLKMAAGVALGRMALRKLEQVRRPRRRGNVATTIAILGAGVAVALIARDLWLRREETPEWPSRKKLEREARQREARLRAQAESNKPPPEIHVERNAETSLKATLGDVAGDGLRR